ncbi:uncharacterized protein LOC101737310 isoform X1 [Bombyx mori]|uniref:Uncharacterized protein n=1 Tax=Bombyx mori TaxID=7091 RepID=A0A8R2QXH3_BOMMO|nr:uncharacterized protein LOC101737310 isoform X2 [Bombyx mori]
MVFLSAGSKIIIIITMTRNKHIKGSHKGSAIKVLDKSLETVDKPTNSDCLDEEEQGFGGWLRSTNGLETMKLFVIANSIVMLTTLAYPHMQNIIGIVSDLMYGPDSIY